MLVEGPLSNLNTMEFLTNIFSTFCLRGESGCGPVTGAAAMLWRVRLAAHISPLLIGDNCCQIAPLLWNASVINQICLNQGAYLCQTQGRSLNTGHQSISNVTFILVTFQNLTLGGNESNPAKQNGQLSMSSRDDLMSQIVQSVTMWHVWRCQ